MKQKASRTDLHEGREAGTRRARDANDLFRAVLALDTVAEARRFFTDLCTPAELEALADRWRVAGLLERGMPYREIHDRTGVSTATVTRVGRSLTHGAGGYRLVLDRLAAGKRRGR